MQININVRMKAEYIYDLLLYHTYSQFSGFLVNILGLAVMIVGGFMLGAGKIGLGYALLYIVAGVGFLIYNPLLLKRRAKQMMQMDKYSDELVYSFDEEGIAEQFRDTVSHFTWDQITKAQATPKDIAFYTGPGDALIVPKESFGDHFMPVMKLVAENMTIDRIYIR